MRALPSSLLLSFALFVNAHAADEPTPALDNCAAGHPGEFAAEHASGPAAREALQARMQARLGQLGLSGTQQQDLQALVALYAERLQSILQLGADDRRKLLLTSPLDPDYGTLTNRVSQSAATAAADTVNTLSELQRTAFDLLTNEQQDRMLVLRAAQFEKLKTCAEAKRAAEKDRAGPPRAP